MLLFINKSCSLVKSSDTIVFFITTVYLNLAVCKNGSMHFKIVKVKVRGVEYYQARRANGTVLSSRKVSESKFSLTSAQEIFKRYRTFYPGQQREDTMLANVIESRIQAKGRFPERFKGKVPYSKANDLPMLIANVFADYGGKRVGGSSGFVESMSKRHLDDAMETAERKFFVNLSYVETGEYDEDEGRNIAVRRHIQPVYSWTTYKPIAG